MIYSIPVVTRLQDGGDGGYTTYVYGNEEEMLADHPKAKDGEMSAEMRRDILTEDDPYENGYLGSGTIEIEVTGKGKSMKLTLAKRLFFHGGQ